MKYINLGFISLLLLFIAASCSEDKGNYTYEDVPEITITGVQESYDLMRGVDSLVFTPTVTSSTEGEIAADNPNYEYGCLLRPTNGTSFGENDNSYTHDMNPDKTQAFTYGFSEMVGSYQGIYTVTDKRTNVTAYHTFNISLRSSVYEGWMVLCNEGDDNRVRLDMVSVISSDRITPVYDLLNESFPEQHNATQIMFAHNMYATTGDYIYLMTETGSYKLDRTEMTAETADNVEGGFLCDLNGDVPIRFAACGCCPPGSSGHFMTTKNGNVYINTLSGSGAAYEYLGNTSTELGDAEYRVSSYIGVGMERNGLIFQPNSTAALFYDIDNKRFMTWNTSANDQLLSEVPEGGATFIPFKTGQDLVYMEGTSYNQNVVFAILEDEGGARSVLATNLTDNQYVQENYYEDIQAENFNVAEHFAFHSQYPYMFYAYGNKVYTYQLGTGITTDISLPAGEEITMLKIDLWKWLMPSSIPEDKVAEQHYVLVGSYNPATGGDNGGILRRYRLNNSTNSLELVNEWSGFAKIVDVCYRERF